MTAFKSISRANVGKEAWDICAEQVAQAWLWHQWDVINAYASWDGAEDRSFAIADEAQNDKLVCVCPLLHFPRRGIFSSLLSRLESTGGPAIDETLSKRQLAGVQQTVRTSLLQAALQTGAYRVDLSFPPLAEAFIDTASPAINPAAYLGFRDSSTYTWIADLRGMDQNGMWKKIDHRVRKSVNKARRLGMTVRKARDEDLGRYMDLHEESCRRLGIASKPRTYFESILSSFHDSGKAMVLAGCDGEGEAQTFHAFALAKSKALYWTVAGNETALEAGLNDLVQWEAIARFLDANVQFYETGEAFLNSRDGKLKRISDFKKGFAADLHPYFRGTLITRPILGASIAWAKAVLGRDNGV